MLVGYHWAFPYFLFYILAFPYCRVVSYVEKSLLLLNRICTKRIIGSLLYIYFFVLLTPRLLCQGAQPCNYYAKHGVCKYGPTCKFDHPMGTLSYTPSTSSLSALSDMPIFPVNLPYTTAGGDIQSDMSSSTESVSPQLTFSVTVSSCGSNAPVSVGSSFSN
jgi:Zinc finger C-x8-C-x5-C-x3-H type (and similar)